MNFTVRVTDRFGHESAKEFETDAATPAAARRNAGARLAKSKGMSPRKFFAKQKAKERFEFVIV